MSEQWASSPVWMFSVWTLCCAERSRVVFGCCCVCCWCAAPRVQTWSEWIGAETPSPGPVTRRQLFSEKHAVKTLWKTKYYRKIPQNLFWQTHSLMASNMIYSGNSYQIFYQRKVSTFQPKNTPLLHLSITVNTLHITLITHFYSGSVLLMHFVFFYNSETYYIFLFVRKILIYNLLGCN